MFSTLLSCKQDQERSFKQVEGRPSKYKPVGRGLTIATLTLSFLALTLMIRFSEADVKLESQVGKPCICNSTFWRQCPAGGNCLEDLVLDPSSDDSELGPPSMDHDDLHPDHVDIDPLFGGYPPYRPINEPLASIGGSAPAIRHRKVYLTPRQKDWQPRIHTFKITIPITPPTYEPANMPRPKPVFKYKKFTTYENKQEVQMVPVTKTIIKPVGVSPDQIIDDDHVMKVDRRLLPVRR